MPLRTSVRRARQPGEDGWADLDAVLAEVVVLSQAKAGAESDFRRASDTPKADAWP